MHEINNILTNHDYQKPLNDHFPKVLNQCYAAVRIAILVYVAIA